MPIDIRCNKNFSLNTLYCYLHNYFDYETIAIAIQVFSVKFCFKKNMLISYLNTSGISIETTSESKGNS